MKISIKSPPKHMSRHVALAPSLNQLFIWIGDHAAPEHPKQWPNPSRHQESSTAGSTPLNVVPTQPTQHH